MMTVDQFVQVTGLYAHLSGIRKRLDTLAPEARPEVFKLEERIRALGLEPGSTQFPAPEDPSPVVAVAKAA